MKKTKKVTQYNDREAMEMLLAGKTMLRHCPGFSPTPHRLNEKGVLWRVFAGDNGHTWGPTAPAPSYWTEEPSCP